MAFSQQGTTVAQSREDASTIVVNRTFIEVVSQSKHSRRTRRCVTADITMEAETIRQRAEFWEKLETGDDVSIYEVATTDGSDAISESEDSEELEAPDDMVPLITRRWSDAAPDDMVPLSTRRWSDASVPRGVDTPSITPWMTSLDACWAPDMPPSDLNCGFTSANGLVDSEQFHLNCWAADLAYANPDQTAWYQANWSTAHVPHLESQYFGAMSVFDRSSQWNHLVATKYEEQGFSAQQSMHCDVSRKCAQQVNQAATCEEQRTTVMLRNIPKSCTRAILREVLDEEGFVGAYDLVYVPTDFSSKLALGYAFVNVLDHAIALRCFEHFEGFMRWPVPSDQPCNVTWSTASQGLEAHIERYRSSPVMHESIPDEWKPAIFSKQGVRLAFPPPLKAIPAPKIRQPKDGKDEKSR